MLLLIVFTFAVALHTSNSVLERLPHVQDSVTYLYQAQTLARGRLFAPAPPLADPDASAHFAQEFLLVRDGRWFGKYPPGYPALLALGVAAGGHWLVNPLLAALTVPLLWRLAQALYRGDRRRPTADRRPQTTDDRLTATDLLSTDPLTTDHWPLLPPLLLTLSPFFLVMSGSLMAHAAELLWTTLAMLAWVKMGRGGAWRWAVVAGVACGMLFLTRQFTAVLVFLAFGLPWLALTARRNRSRSPSPVATVFVPASLFALAVAPFLLTLPAYQATLTGSPRTDPRLLFWPYDRVGFGFGIGEPENVFTFTDMAAGPAIAWRTDPAQPPRGHTPARGLYNLGRNLDALEKDLFGWPALFSLAFLWFAFLLRRPAVADWALLALLLAFAGGYVTYWHAGLAYGPRYFYAALPALTILTARGASALATAAHRATGAAAKPAVLLVIALLIGYNLITLPGRIEGYRGYNFIDGAGRAAVEGIVASPALVFVTTGTADWWQYGAFFNGNTPWLDGPVVYARDLGAVENRRLWAEFPGRGAYLWREGRLVTLGAQPDGG